MKNSNKILLGIGAVVIISIIVSLISIRVFVDKAVKDSGGIEAINRSFEGDLVNKDYDIRNFSELKISGGWSVSLSSDDNYKVSVSFPKELEDKIVVEKNGNTLSLSTKGLIDFKGAHFKAEIRMPDLEKLSSQGGMTADLKGFKGKTLSMECGGGVQIKAKECTYDNLRLQLSGGIQGDLDDLSAKNVHVEGNGAVDLSLLVNGGTLSGKVNGAAHIRVKGNVNKNTLQVQGVSNIKYQ